jgi:tetratricopeptide (TPR) repeat protein
MSTGLRFFLSPSATDHRIRPALQRARACIGIHCSALHRRDGTVGPAVCVRRRPGRHHAWAWLSASIIGVICIGRDLGAPVPIPGDQSGTDGSAAPAIQAAPFVFPADDRELLALDEDMVRFFAARVDDRASTFTRLNQIVAAILDEQGLHFAYEKDGDYSARETYRRRRGNCLSFSLLAVAAARAHGLTAWFCEVNAYPRWDRSGSLITEIWHLNVRVSAGAAQYEINPLGGAERQDQVATRRAVSDARAFANFYNNLAVRRLADRAAAEAQALFDRALAADSTAAFVWANKGSALRLAGDYAGANDCLERALKEDPTELAALSNLADLYTQTGRLKQAAQLGKKVERYRLKNPYYLSFLAQAEYSRGQYREAEGHLRRAIAIKDDEPEFYELRILVAQGLGQTADAQRWVAKLQALRARPDPGHPVIHDTGKPP